MSSHRAGYERHVFINVPFDRPYRKLLDALVFAVHACGLTARCALEADDSAEVRLDKIYRIISECRFGIHDLSRTTLDSANRLPRFNMPLELGVFLGARRFGKGDQRRKCCLILDRERYRFQKFCSDISGQDIRAHGKDAGTAMRVVRDWLQPNLGPSRPVPGAQAIVTEYLAFRRTLPRICTQRGLTVGALTFLDYRLLVEEWLDLFWAY